MYDCGVVKIADFGLSRTMPTDKHVILDLDEKFVLTGECGSVNIFSTLWKCWEVLVSF